MEHVCHHILAGYRQHLFIISPDIFGVRFRIVVYTFYESVKVGLVLRFLLLI